MTILEDWQVWSRRDVESPSHVIDDFIHSAATIVSGRPMAGKTTLIASMVAAIAGGDDEFLGHAVNRHGDVWVICTDPGEPRAWGRRIDALRPVPVHRVRVGPYSAGGALTEVIELLGAEPAPALIVLDNALGAVKGDIRDNAAARKLLDQLHAFTDLDAPVLLAAHSSARQFEDGTYAKGPMGTTAFDAWDRLTVHVESTADDAWLVTAHGNESPKVEHQIGVVWRGDGLPELRILNGPPRRGRNSANATQRRREEFVRTRIIGNPALLDVASMAGVARTLGVPGSNVWRALNACPAEHVPGVGWREL